MTIFILVSVPRNARISKDCRSALAFGLGRNGKKVSARLIHSDPCKQKGRKIICRAEQQLKNGQVQIHLIPTSRKSATHNQSILKNGELEFSPIV